MTKNSKFFLPILILIYICIFSFYNLSVASNYAELEGLLDSSSKATYIIYILGLFGNLFSIVISVNLAWLFTSIGAKYTYNQPLKDMDGPRKKDYYMIYFGLYLIHFLFMIVINKGTTLVDSLETFNKVLNVSNLTAIIIVFILTVKYMYSNNILNKISFSGILGLTIIGALFSM
jgi:hypothetical protein